MKIHEAIMKLNSSIVMIRGDVAYDVNGNVVEYNKDEAEKLIIENEYKELRAKEYPSFAEQFDLLYHGGYDAWKAVIQDVKDKYPKGAE